MLSWLRASKGGIFFKVVAGVVIFGLLFGMSNMFERKSSGEVVFITVNDTNISEPDLLNALSRETTYFVQGDWDLHSQLGRDTSVAILIKLVKEKLLEEEVTKLGLQVPDEVVQSVLRNAFYNETLGFFDRQQLEATRAALRMNEASYLNYLRSNLRQEQLLLTVSGTLSHLPPQLVDLYHDYLTAEHQLAYVAIDNDLLVPKNLQTTDQELRAFYSSHPELFIEPETRTFSYITIQRGDLSNRDYNKLINDLEVAASQPEAKLEQLATDYGKQVTTASWTKSDLEKDDQPLKPVGKYVFGLNEGLLATSKLRLVNNISRNTYWLVKVNQLASQKVYQYEEVKKEVKQLFRAEQLQKLAQEKANQLAQEINSEKQLARLTNKYSKVVTEQLTRNTKVEEKQERLNEFLLDLERGSTQVLALDGQQIIAYKTAITKIKPVNSESATTLKFALLGRWRDELRETYVRILAEKAQITVDEPNLGKYLQEEDIRKLKNYLLLENN